MTRAGANMLLLRSHDGATDCAWLPKGSKLGMQTDLAAMGEPHDDKATGTSRGLISLGKCLMVGQASRVCHSS